MTMTEPGPISLTEWVVLTVVDEAPTHGFAVATLTAADGDLGRIWRIPRPIIYRALGRLDAAGLVTPDSVEPGRGPRRRLYASTPAGRAAVARWLDTPVEHVRDVRSHLLLKLALRERRGQRPADLLHRQRQILTPIAGALQRSPRVEPSGFEAMLVAWRRANTQATLAFLDEMMASSP
jgi:DNA-binding PadR family transcriptional regulator